VDKVTRGTGRVLPSTQNQLVQHLEGGIVKEILVDEGQRVNKGQVPTRISNASTGAAIESARTDLVAKRIILARLDAEISGAGSFVPPPDLARQAPEIAASEAGVFASRRAQRVSQVGVINQQALAKSAEVGSLQARLGNLAQRGTAGDGPALKAGTRLCRRCDLRTRCARQARHAAFAAHADCRCGKPDPAIFRRAWRIRGPTRRNLGRATWNRSARKPRSSGSNSRKPTNSSAPCRTAWTCEEIRAPVDGVINRLNVRTVGGVIRGGEPVAEIVPAASQVIIEARIAPKDRGNIWPGLPARIKISAYDLTVYGSLEAKVVDVSPDAIQDPRGGLYYRVRLDAGSASFGPGMPVIPGMTGEVAIRSGNQTILNYLLGPADPHFAGSAPGRGTRCSNRRNSPCWLPASLATSAGTSASGWGRLTGQR